MCREIDLKVSSRVLHTLILEVSEHRGLARYDDVLCF